MQQQSTRVTAAAVTRVLILAAVVALGACERGAAQGGGDRPPPEVGVLELEHQAVPMATELPGRTAPYRVAEVRPQVSGIIRERSFRQGAEVESGDVLYSIDPRPFRAAVARAEGELAGARAQVPPLEQREARLASLLESESVSQQEYDNARAALEEARAGVQVAQADLETARTELDYTSVAAPIPGRVGPTQATTGALVTAQQEAPLTRVTQLDPIYVDIQRSVSQVRALRRQLAEGELTEIDDGTAAVELLLPEGGTYEHAGELAVSDITVDPDTSTITLRAVFPNPDHDLLPGMYVRARVSEGVREQAILAPQQGVTRNPRGEPTALVVDSDNTVVKRELEVSRAIGSFWLVDSGLEAGDRLIVSGLQRASEGATVTPATADIPNQPADDAPQADSVEEAQALSEGDSSG